MESIDGREVLIHLGVDTVKLKGEGFETFVEENQTVKVGDKLVKMDVEFIEKNAKLLLQALSVFRKEWGKYSDSLDKIGGFIDKLSNEYRELMVTRTKKLDKSINELELLNENNEIYLEEK